MANLPKPETPVELYLAEILRVLERIAPPPAPAPKRVARRTPDR